MNEVENHGQERAAALRCSEGTDKKKDQTVQRKRIERKRPISSIRNKIAKQQLEVSKKNIKFYIECIEIELEKIQ